MNFKIKSIKFQNFKCFSSYDLTPNCQNVIVSGANGSGKTSIIDGIMWLLFGTDGELNSNPKVRREVHGKSTDDVDVSVEAVFITDTGKEITARKVQKRVYSKSGGEVTDPNTYFINEVSMTLRDFQAYFGVDMEVMQMCSNVHAFLSKKPADMRKFLFSIASAITDLDVAIKFGDLQLLREPLENYTLEEIKKMNSASKTRTQKEIDGIPIAITELTSMLNAVDLSDLELQKNALNEQIIECEKKLADSMAAMDDFDSASREVMELKTKRMEIEQSAIKRLELERQIIQKRIDDAEKSFKNAMDLQSTCETSISSGAAKIKIYKAKKREIEESGARIKERIVAIESEELPKNVFNCPTCGQDLPVGKKQSIIADFAVNKQGRIDRLNADRDREAKGWYECDGHIKELAAKVKEGEALLEDAKGAKLNSNSDKTKAMQELSEMPLRPDLSDNQEYEALCTDIITKEGALKELSTGADYRKQISTNLDKLRSELSGVEKQIYSNDTSKIEDRIAELRDKHKAMEQEKANCEQVLYLVDELEKHKNEMLTDEINSHFKHVRWKLFDFAKNGGYKNVCIPMIDGFEYGSTTNEGRDFLIRADICNSIQNIANCSIPVVVDQCAELDNENLAGLVSMMDCQVILLRVNNSEKLNMEVI